MRSIVTDGVVWSVGRSVCWSVTRVSLTKTAKPIDMPFGLWIRVGQRNQPSIRWGPDPPCERNILKGNGAAHCKVQEHSAVSCAKMAEPTENPFGMLSGMGPRKHVLYRVAPPGEYDWTVHVRWRCGLCVKLLWSLVINVITAVHSCGNNVSPFQRPRYNHPSSKQNEVHGLSCF